MANLFTKIFDMLYFFFITVMSNFFLFIQFFYDKKNITNVAKHEISKWRLNSRWMSKRFYRLKLVNLIIF
jgi:hypothetical protein